MGFTLEMMSSLRARCALHLAQRNSRELSTYTSKTRPMLLLLLFRLEALEAPGRKHNSNTHWCFLRTWCMPHIATSTCRSAVQFTATNVDEACWTLRQAAASPWPWQT
jgi:hypothetical protein